MAFYIKQISQFLHKIGYGDPEQELVITPFAGSVLDDLTADAAMWTYLSGLSTETSPAVDDTLIIGDTSESAGNKITAQNFLKVVNGLTEDTSPDVSSDYLLEYDTSAGTAKKVKPSAFSSLSMPQGRLTLQTLTPVMTTTQSAKTTVYYTPYVGEYCPIYNGTSFTMTDTGGELSQLTTDTTKSPAAVTTNSNYDVFVWNDSGTMRATRGPAWSSTTSRGTGAGTTELVMVQGIYLNANAITNGPGAQRGTYVGTISSNGSSQIDWIFGAVANNGTAGFFNVWNAYQRVWVSTMVGDSADSWTYTSTTWRSAHNSTGMRVTFVRGLNEDAIQSAYQCTSLATTAGTTTTTGIGVGLDSTSTPGGATGVSLFQTSNALRSTNNGTYYGVPGLGLHFVQALESGDTGGVFYGDNGGAIYQNGLSVLLRA
jgi:hypothetical protein